MLAQPKSVSDKDKQVASDLVKKAIARSQAGDHSAAIDIYLQAYTIVPNSILLSNIGSEFQQQGKQKEALRYFCMYLDKDPTGTNAPYATTQARSLQALLGNPKPGDDDDVCAPPKVPHKRPVEDPVDKTDPPPPKPHPGSVADDAPPAREDDTTMRYAGFAFGAAGVVGLGIGVYAGVEAKSISDQITSHPKGTMWQNGIQDLQRKGQNYEYLQIGGLLGGGVLAGVGVILYLRSMGSGEAPHDSADKPNKADKDKSDRTVHVTPTSNGLAVFGRF